MAKPNNPKDLTADDLRNVRIRLGLTIPTAAKKLGVDRATWWRWEETETPVPEKHYHAILAMLEEEGVPAREVVPFPGGAPRTDMVREPSASYLDTVQVPIYTPAASAGPGLEITNEWVNGHLGLESGYIRNVLQCQPTSLFAVVVDGDSMEPGIRSGEIALVAKSTDGGPIRDGIHLLRLEGSLLCKRLGRLPGHRLAVASDNPAYPAFEIDLDDDRLDFTVLGRIVGLLRRV